MPDFLRRMLEGTIIARNAEDGSGTPTPPPLPDAGDAGGDAGSGETPPGNAPAAGDSGVSPPEPAPPATPEPDRAQQRMNQLVAERWAERRRAEAAEQQARLLQERLSQVQQTIQTPQVDADGNPVTPVAPQPQVQRQFTADDLQRQAQQIAEQNEFNRQVAAEVQRGRGVYAQDFDQVAANLQQFGELPRTFVEAALATGKGADVIYHLGKDIVEASRILGLPPMAQAVALAQIAHGVKAPEPPKTVSSAPPPVSPKVGDGKKTNTPSLEDADLPIADWIKLREKNLPKSARR
jgi:hypothetical protein